MTRRLLLAAFAAVWTASLAPAQFSVRRDGPDKTLDAAARAKAIDGVLTELDKAYVFPETAKKMADSIRAKQAKGEYDAESSARAFAKRLTDDLRAVSKDGHLGVVYSPDPLPSETRWPTLRPWGACDAGNVRTRSWRFSPYASAGGMGTFTLLPTSRPVTAFSKPGMTLPSPSLKVRGSLPLELSNSVPSSRVPV